ncbi:G5 domain-containing protein [Pseudoramibacter alactolyticus]|uniref:G5 domain-containing protein n=1 Tax=Pseudoramibacter alactolyticus TaxID=113287 RepID=UPI002353B6C3|nr:G5 domain-containing protein [Pseudoramibacter alactolyticus]MBM6967636.1 G5 domain-containing protein [Pseudoramibacter alactolyticus]
MSTRIKRAIFLVLIAAAALAVTGFVVNSRRNHNKKITVVYDENTGQSDDAATKAVTAKGTETIQTLLKDNGYTVDKDIYAYSVNLNKRTSDIAKVTITKKAKGTLIVGDQTQYYSTAKKTVGGMLAEKNITVGQNDIVTPSKSSPMNTTVKKVQVVRVTKSTVKSEVTLPYQTKVVSNDAVPQGTVKVLQSGNTGIQNVKTVVTRHNGVLVSEKEKSKDIAKVATDMKVQVNPQDYKAASEAVKTKENAKSAGTAALPSSTNNNSDTASKDKASTAPASTDNKTTATPGKEDAAKIETTVTKQTIPFETIKVHVANMQVGQQKEQQAGVDGTKTIQTKTTIKGGQVIATESTVVSATDAKPQIIAVGTQTPASNDTVKTENTTQASTNNTATTTEENKANTVNNSVQTPNNGSDSSAASVSNSTSTNNAAANANLTGASAKTPPSSTSPATTSPTSATTTANATAAKAPVQKTAVETTSVNSSKLSADGTAALKSGATSGHKTAGLNAANYNLICAVVAAEDNTSYTGALAVASCIMNRADSGRWGGATPVAVITAKGQFSAYIYGNYKKYADGKAPSYVKAAVSDCMTYGLRNHSYTSFRAGSVKDSKKIGANYYF